MISLRHYLLLLFAFWSSSALSQPGDPGGCYIDHVALPDGTLLMLHDSNLVVYTTASPEDEKHISVPYFSLQLNQSYSPTNATRLTISVQQEDTYLFIQFKGQNMCAIMDVPGIGPNYAYRSTIDTLYFRPGNWRIHQYNRRGMTPEHLSEYRSRSQEPNTENYWLFELDHHTRLAFPMVERMSQNTRIRCALDLIRYTTNNKQIIKLGEAIWADASNAIEKQFGSNFLWLAYERIGEIDKAYEWYLKFYKVWDNKYGQQGVVDFLVKIKHPEEALRFLSDMINLEPHPYNYVTRGNFYETVLLNYYPAVLDYQEALKLEKDKAPKFINPLASSDVAYLYFRMGRTYIKANLTVAGLEEIKKCVYSAHYYTHYEETLALLDSLESTCSMSSDLYFAMALCEYRLAALYPNVSRSPDNLYTDAELHFTMAEERGGDANLLAFFRADYYRILNQKEKALAYLKMAELDNSLKESCENLLPYITLLR